MQQSATSIQESSTYSFQLVAASSSLVLSNIIFIPTFSFIKRPLPS